MRGAVTIGVLGEIAAVNEDVGVGRERALDRREIGRVASRHRGGVERRRAEIELRLATVREDVDVLDALVSGKVVRDLVDAVLARIEQNDPRVGIDVFDQILQVGNVGLDEDDGLILLCAMVAQVAEASRGEQAGDAALRQAVLGKVFEGVKRGGFARSDRGQVRHAGLGELGCDVGGRAVERDALFEGKDRRAGGNARQLARTARRIGLFGHREDPWFRRTARSGCRSLSKKLLRRDPHVARNTLKTRSPAPRHAPDCAPPPLRCSRARRR